MKRQSSGQATVEYILLLVTVVSIFFIVSKVLVRPLFKSGLNAAKAALESSFSSGNLHRFRVP